MDVKRVPVPKVFIKHFDFLVRQRGIHFVGFQEVQISRKGFAKVEEFLVASLLNEFFAHDVVDVVIDVLANVPSVAVHKQQLVLVDLEDARLHAAVEGKPDGFEGNFHPSVRLHVVFLNHDVF